MTEEVRKIDLSQCITQEEALAQMTKQDHRLYEPDYDNITSLDQLKELFKSMYIQMTFDLEDKTQLKEVEELLAKKIIKEITNIELTKKQ